MPIYEYQCTACQHGMELIQKVNDPEQTLCPNCGKNSLVKLVSAAGFQLKGTGWYATDFKTKPAQAPSEKPAESTATTTDTKTESPKKTTETKGDSA